MAIVDNSNLKDLINERNSYLSNLKNSLGKDEESFLVLEKIKSSMKYLETFTINEVNEEILKWIMPLIKNSLTKAFSENSDLSDTADDEFIVIIFKQNLKVAAEIMQVVATILNFITEQKEVKIGDISCLPSNVGEVIIVAFEHCKNSTDSYKSIFNVELLELFKITQEVHSVFLNLMVSFYILDDDDAVDSTDEMIIIKQVLDNVCHLSEILFKLNFKSCTTNWKGYINILNKYLLYVKELVDIKIPINLIISEIVENMESITKLISTDSNKVCQIVKLTSFLIRVILKILDIFWTKLKNVLEEVVLFCLSIYSYPLEYFLSLGSSSIANLVNNEIFPIIESFIQRLTVEDDLLGMITDFKTQYDKYPVGSIYFIDILLRITCESGDSTKLNLNKIASVLFYSLKSSYAMCYWDFTFQSVFDRLVVHLAGAVISHPKCYSEIEHIMLENVLDESTWCALLSIDSWTMILSVCPSQLSLRTLIDLINLEEKLDFGVNTHRPEHVHLKCLIKRIFELLPNDAKSEVVKNFPPRTNHSAWKIIGLENIPEREIPIFYEIAMNNIEKLGSDNFTINNLKVLAETFELLSTFNFIGVNFDITALVDAIISLWEVNNIALFNNNVFRFFITKLCKLTRVLIKVFNYKQLLAILSQLKLLSSHETYKLSVCIILESIPDRNFNDFGQNGYRIFQLTSQIIACLMTSNSNVVKQNVLELIQSLRNNGKENIVNDILKTSTVDVQREIFDYFNKEQKDFNFDKDYYEALKNNKYEHKCVQWRNVVPKRINKRLKHAGDAPTYSLGRSHQLGVEKLKQNKTLSVNQPHFSRSKSMPNDSIASAQNENDTISEAIDNLKGDVKCLTNILKTEKLSAKNVSDLKMVASQLLSLM